MTFISYAQNYEDVMLWRALKHIKKGFYIDVGAQNPVNDSVTKAFYEAGWRGINIEPVETWYSLIDEARPEDINIQSAMGNKEGEVQFFEVVDTGLSTTDEELAKKHEAELGFEIKSYPVPLTTLDAVCNEHVERDVHFLKIDVEGAEQEVLEGIDLNDHRPWIIIIESTLPNSREENFEMWEELILDHNYQYVYFDGLNRFYIAEERNDLADAFKIPPNFFDNFKTLRTRELEEFSDFQSQELVRFDEQIKNLAAESAGLKDEKVVLLAKHDQQLTNTENLTSQLENLNLQLAQFQEKHEIAKREFESELSALSADRDHHLNHGIHLQTEIVRFDEQIKGLNAQLELERQKNNSKIEAIETEYRQIVDEKNKLKRKNILLAAELSEKATTHEYNLLKFANINSDLLRKTEIAVKAHNRISIKKEKIIQKLRLDLRHQRLISDEQDAALSMLSNSLIASHKENDSASALIAQQVAQISTDQGRLEALETTLENYISKNHELDRILSTEKNQTLVYRENYQTIANSTSWKVTAPLRTLARIFRSPKTLLKSVLRRILRIMNGNRLLKPTIGFFLLFIPRGREKARQLLAPTGNVASPLVEARISMADDWVLMPAQSELKYWISHLKK